MKARRFLWEKGLFKDFTPAYPCVAVGNIAWGGSGKTPLVDWLLSRTAKQGLEAVVLTRGYGAHPPVLPFPVSPASTAEEAGDEPLMLRLRHPAAAILVDPVRARAARLAEQTLNPDLLVLDDGFQHLAVRRHLNLVLLRPEDLRVYTLTEDRPAGPHLTGRIEESVYKGATVDLIVTLSDGRRLMAAEFFNEDDVDINYNPGETVTVSWVDGWEVVLPDGEA